MQKQQKRFFIFDPCFGSLTGHWENYCKRLYQELKNRGYTPLVFGQKNFDKRIVGPLNFEGVFEASPFLPARNMLDLKKISNLFLDDFEKIDANRFQDGDIFIFHSIYPNYFSAIIDWTKEIASKKRVVSTFFFQFPPSNRRSEIGFLKNLYFKLRRKFAGEDSSSPELEWADNNQVRFYQRTIPNLKKLVGKSHLLMASTDVLSRNFSALFGLKVYYLPMPGEDLSDIIARSKQASQSKKQITIGYFGHASLEKGGQFLADLVEKTNQNYRNIDFILHINPNGETENYLAYFKNKNHPNIKCHYGHLSQDNMMELVAQVDIVLMPYSPIKYATTPSAIFTEAMPLEKVFVMPVDTWAYKEAVKYHAGISTFKNYSLKSIQVALNKAIDRFELLQEKSRLAGASFHNENNMKHYIDVFINYLSRYDHTHSLSVEG